MSFSKPDRLQKIPAKFSQKFGHYFFGTIRGDVLAVVGWWRGNLWSRLLPKDLTLPETNSEFTPENGSPL